MSVLRLPQLRYPAPSEERSRGPRPARSQIGVPASVVACRGIPARDHPAARLAVRVAQRGMAQLLHVSDEAIQHDTSQVTSIACWGLCAVVLSRQHLLQLARTECQQ